MNRHHSNALHDHRRARDAILNAQRVFGDIGFEFGAGGSAGSTSGHRVASGGSSPPDSRVSGPATSRKNEAERAPDNSKKKTCENSDDLKDADGDTGCTLAGDCETIQRHRPERDAALQDDNAKTIRHTVRAKQHSFEPASNTFHKCGYRPNCTADARVTTIDALIPLARLYTSLENTHQPVF